MKKFLLILFLLVAIRANAQIAYYDALKLHSFLSGDSLKPDDIVFAILDKYVDPLNKNSSDVIKDLLTTNPFIKIAKNHGSATETLVGATLPSNVITYVGNLSVTNLADALAKFLIERSKAELSIAFFENFKKDLKNNPEIKVLFPNTASFIEHIEAYNYASFLQTLRVAFQMDLMTLPTGFRNLRDLTEDDCDGSNGCIKRIQAIRQFFEYDEASILYVASTIVMDSLKVGASLPDILSAISHDKQLLIDTFKESNIRNIILLADLFSRSLTSNKKEVFISTTEFEQLKDTTLLKIYLGLIYQQCKEAKITLRIGNKSIMVTEIIKPAMAKKYYDYAERIINAGQQLNVVAKEINDKKDKHEKFTPDDYVNYLSATVDVLEHLMTGDVMYIAQPQGKANDIIAVLRSAIAIYYNIESAEYSAAISNAFIILDITLKDSYKHKGKILRYGSFMASVVQAESSEDVKNAIEAAALPAGSASIKKNSCWSITLNTYLGGFYGQEYLANKTSNKWNNTVGVAAPIGIALSHRFFWKMSLSGFVTVLDIGGVASYRLKDSNTEKLPELKLQNIFAPGYGFVLGLPRWPVSIGYISQLGPALRQINADAVTVSDQLNKRNYFFVGVDIPLINFYTRPMK